MRPLERAALIDAARAGGIAAVLALPLLGFRLVDSAQGLSLGVRLWWVAYAAVAVFAARLAWGYIGELVAPNFQRPPPGSPVRVRTRLADLPALGEVTDRAEQASEASYSET